MNNQARNCKLICKYNVQGICSTYGECISKELFIEKLEQIKAEITDLTEFLYIDSDVFRILDEHISELKGDSNVVKSNV